MKVTVFNTNIQSIIIKYFFMMAVVIGGGFTGQWWLALLALPIFLSAIMGLEIEAEPAKQGRVVPMDTTEKITWKKAG